METIAVASLLVGIIFGAMCFFSEKLEEPVLYAGRLLFVIGICVAACYHETFGYFPPATPIVPYMEAIGGPPQSNLVEQCLGIFGGFLFPLLTSMAAIFLKENVPLWLLRRGGTR